MIGQSMSPTPPRGRVPPTAKPVDQPDHTLISDEPTIELVIRAQGGDRMAVEALLERCLPPLKRWAHGRLPSAARGHLDTGDIVQECALHVLGRLDHFEPRHVGAMQAYLRQSVINRIRDEIRRVGRRPTPSELPLVGSRSETSSAAAGRRTPSAAGPESLMNSREATPCDWYSGSASPTWR